MTPIALAALWAGAAESAQFNVTAGDLNGGPGQIGSAAWALAQSNAAPGNHVVDFDATTDLVLLVPQQVLRDVTLQIDKHLVMQGALSGQGTLTKTGAGYLVLLANNTLIGDINLDQGGLVVVAGDAIHDSAQVAMRSGTELEVIGSETIGSLSGTGALMGSNVGGNILTLGGNGASTSFAFETPALNILGNTPCYLLSLTKTGDGTFTITGAVPLAGDLRIEAGKLVMNGISGMSATVAHGSTLGGSGHLGSVTIDGILAPGNSIGTLHMGAAIFNTGSVLQIEIAPGGNTPGLHNDLLEVSGSVTINGGTVQIVGGSGDFAGASSFTILTAAAGGAGRFDAVTDDLAFYNVALRYDPHAVFADLSFAGYSGLAGLTPNQQAVAQTLDSMIGAVPYADALSGLSNAQGAAAFDQLAGEGFAAQQSALMLQSNALQTAALDRIDQAFAALPTGTANGYMPSSVQIDTVGTSAVWGAVYGGVVHRSSTDISLASNSADGGLVMGIDGEITQDWRLGVMASAGLSRFSAGNHSGDSHNLGAGVYLGGRTGIVDVKLGAAYSRHFIDSSRAISFGGLSDTLSAQYQAGTGQVFAELSHAFEFGATTITPFGRVELVQHNSDGFTETGGAGALSLAASSQSQARTTLGVAADYAFVVGETILAKASMRLGWEHGFDDAASVSSSFVAGGSSFAVSAGPVPRDALRLGGSLSFDINDHLAVAASYDGRLGEGLATHAAAVGLSGRF